MSRRALLASALLLLGVSLGLKWLVASGARTVDEIGFARTLAARLNVSGFDAAVVRRFTATVVVAQRGDCRFLIRHARRIAYRARTYEQVAKPYGGLSYRWSGAWISEPPVAELTFRSLVQEQLARLGVDTRRPALLGVAATARCRATLPDLDGLTVGTKPTAPARPKASPSAPARS